METKLGDVFIFEAGDSWLSKSIARLTNSTVSHAAMLYSDAGIIEMGGSGIGVSQFQQAADGEEVYLLRLESQPDPAPLVQAADHYLKEGVEYDFAELVLLAGLLIYRAIRPTPRWKKVTDIILNAACYQLDQLLNRMLHHGEKVPAMVCSQMVYQIYRDCGQDYEIVLKDALLQADYHTEAIRLIDFMESNEEESAPFMTASYAEIPDTEAMARELYLALEEAQTADSNALLQTSELASLSPVAAKFLDLVEKILESSGVSIPLEAMFVAPSDLLSHSENLKQYGTMKLKRV